MHTDRSHRRTWAFVLFIAATLLLASAPALASEPAGRVLTTKGEVTATDRDDFQRPLSRNDVVYPGETLRTGSGARLQVRFRDDGLVDLKPDSVFEIERYEEATGERGGSAVMHLLKGALRTITGAIGKGEDDQYAVDTPVATIGIRGTDYSLEFCDSACAGNGRAPGLYGRVDEGSIVTETGAGSSAFDTGDYFFVPQGGAPQRIIAPPEGILVDDEEEDEGESVSEDFTSSVDQDGNEGPQKDLLAEGEPLSSVDDPTYEAGELNPAVERTSLQNAFVTSAFAGAKSDGSTVSNTHSFLSPREDEAYVDDSGSVVLLDTSDFGAIDLATMNLEDSGLTPAGDGEVVWGRWAGDFTADGESVTGGFSFAYADADLLSTPTQLSNLGVTIAYGSPAGPHGIDQSGNAWSVDELTFNANFIEDTLAFGSMTLTQVEGGNMNFTLDGTDVNTTGIDISQNQFRIEFLNSRGQIVGSFLGDSALDALAEFAVMDSDRVNRIIGTQVLDGALVN